MARADNFAFFLTTGEKFSIFYHKEWCYLWVVHEWPSSGWGSTYEFLICWVFFIRKGCYCYNTKMQLFSFSLSSFPFLISFQSLVGHRDGIRKEEALGCCASTPRRAPWASICHLLPPVCIADPEVPLLFWLKLHPSHFDLLCWPTVSWFWVSGFLSLFFRVQIPLPPLPRCPRLLWQLLVFGKLKAVFQQ